MPTKAQVLYEKKANLIDFLLNVAPEKDKAGLLEVKSVPGEMFLFFVLTELVPKRDNLGQCVDDFLQKTGVPPVEAAVKERVVAYLRCFTEIASSK